MAHFINVSNHPSAKWGAEQRAAAEAFGEITDLAFPNVEPSATTEEIGALADLLLWQIPAGATVLCQGEWTLAYAMCTRLRARGHRVVVACSRREVEESQGEDGSTRKVAVFRFCGFRDLE